MDSTEINMHGCISVKLYRDFLGSTVVKNPPANARDTGSSPDPGRSHIPQCS